MGRFVLGLGFLLMFCLCCSPAFADSIQYTATGTFSGDVNSAPLSGPNGSYSMSFILPQNPTPDGSHPVAGDFSIFSVPMSYSFQCQGCSTSTVFNGNALDVDFAGPSLDGMFVVEFLTGGHDYYFQFTGETLFAGQVGSPTLLSGGPFNLTNAGVFELDSNDFVDLGSATINVQTIATPEPSTVTLLLVALGTLGVLAIFKSRHA